ncbi:DUF4184 family protein [uncultured Psychrobacter sp.]|uniref:DUF4184 family protein n=1 Tax=uncultured Psychrobacter sp. TaxID=259303 RepID=UPI0026062559|nr:DUF4184 family protein [uncultured Psychrobacter sp.]
MAFTIAHIAAALPLKRVRWLHFDALVIGTLLPDLPYYIDGSNTARDLSHQWLGIISYCLPWGLGIFIIWLWLFKPAVKALIYPWYLSSNNLNILFFSPLSRFLSKKNRAVESCSWLQVKFIFCLSVVLALIGGASTHLVWDGITHPDGFIAIRSAWLQSSLYISQLNETITIARLLQYISSILGLLILLGFASYKLYNYNAIKADNSLTRSDSKLKRRNSILIIALIFTNALYWGWHEASESWHFVKVDNYTFLAQVSTSFMQGAFFALIIYMVIYQIYHHIFCTS